MALFIPGYSTAGQFLNELNNQTVVIGERVEVECRISGCSDALRIYINGMQAAPRNHLSNSFKQSLDRSEYNASIRCDDNEYVGTFWMLVNNRTLSTVDYVVCRTDSQNVTEILRAYFIEKSNYGTEISRNYTEAQIETTSSSAKRMTLSLKVTMIMITLIICLHVSMCLI